MSSPIKLEDYSKVIYVDELGDDTSGLGTEIAPFKTIQKARSSVSVDNTLIYLKKGNYTIGSLSSMLHDSFKLTYVTEASLNSKNLVNVTITSTLNNNYVMSALNTLIGIVFLRGAGGDSRVLEYFYDTSTLNIEFKNCVFDNSKSPTPVTTALIFTGNSGGCTITKLDYRNCSFISYPISGQGQITGTKVSKGFSYNSMSTSELFTSSTSSNLLVTPFYNKDNYSIDGNSNNVYGVYSGDIAWYAIFKTMLFKANNKIYSLKSNEIPHTTKMTSDVLPSPFVASASSTYGTTLVAHKAFSGENADSLSAWASANNSPNGWIQIDYGSKKIANVVYVTNRNDYSSYATTSPKDFNILGSNDGISFDTIAEIRNQTDWVQNETRKFLIKKVKDYRYYRLQVLANNGSAYTSIGEILYAYDYWVSEIPSMSKENFIDYGIDPVDIFNLINRGKNYILQDTISENLDGLWVQDIDRKPLSIKFK